MTLITRWGQSTAGLKSPLLLSFIRLPLLCLLAYALLALLRGPLVFPPPVDFSALYFIAGNVVCFFILQGIVRREGGSLGGLLGFSRERLGRDVLWGLLWALVLYLPFVAVLLGMILLLFGGGALARMADVFTPTVVALPALSFEASLFLAVVTAILFPLTNAPMEELCYRGYAQVEITAATGRAWVGLLIPAVGFSLQHVLLAPTAAAMAPFAAAFFAWGLGAGLIYHRQRRLMPLVVAHFLTNLVAAVVPVAVLILS